MEIKLGNIHPNDGILSTCQSSHIHALGDFLISTNGPTMSQMLGLQ
jgi:hypothetical protein